MPHQHQDDGISIHDFTDLFLVQCPSCLNCAEVKRVNQPDSNQLNESRFCCLNCANSKVSSLSIWQPNKPVDWIFHLPLWLQISCCENTLWAYNFSHLSFLESYVSAKHRKSLSNEAAKKFVIRNSTLSSRLPAWMISAKNRDSVLKAIRKLKAKVVA